LELKDQDKDSDFTDKGKDKYPTLKDKDKDSLIKDKGKEQGLTRLLSTCCK
jgi:hypothetical protein